MKRKRNPDEYLDEREFLPGEMERLVKDALRQRERREPEPFTEKEIRLRWKLLKERRRTQRLRAWRTVLAAACILLTVGLLSDMARPGEVQGNSTTITFITGEGEQEQFLFHYKDFEEVYGRSHRYKSFAELEAVTGFSLLKPQSQTLAGLYLESRIGSDLYSVTAYFDGGPVIRGYQAYFVKEGERSYSHTLSQEWRRFGEIRLGEREITLYQVEDALGTYGAVFAEDGFLYVLVSADGAALSDFEDALGKLCR